MIIARALLLTSRLEHWRIEPCDHNTDTLNLVITTLTHWTWWSHHWHTELDDHNTDTLTLMITTLTDWTRWSHADLDDHITDTLTLVIITREHLLHSGLEHWHTKLEWWKHWQNRLRHLNEAFDCIQIQSFQLVVTMISFVYRVLIFSIHINLSVSALTEVLHDVRNCPVDPRLVVVPDSISSLTATEKKESSWWTFCVSLSRGTKDHEQGWTVFRVRNLCIFFAK